MCHRRHLECCEIALHNTVSLHKHLQHRLQGLGQEGTVLNALCGIIPGDERMLKQRL